MRRLQITCLALTASLAILAMVCVGCGKGGGGGGSGDDGGGGNGGGSASQPVVDFVALGMPICSVDGPGAVDGPVTAGNTGLVHVAVCPTHPSAYMRVWLQVNTSGADIAYYDWQILDWENSVPHGGLEYYDEVVDIDLVEGRYIVRTNSANKIQYASTPNQNINSDFSEKINVVAWTAEGKFVNAYFQVNLHPSGGIVDDHGNTANDATPLAALGTPVDGVISPAGDIDFFSFLAESGKTYSISTGGTTDTVLCLIARNGIDLLAADDDGGPGNLSLIEWTCPASGTYYVRVNGYQQATGAYTLTIKLAGLVVQNGFRPHLSPDGSQIVFTRLSSTASDAQSDIWLINTDGSGLTRLTDTSAASEFSPQWTPDGQSIAFVRKDGPYGSNTMGNLWEIQRDGSSEQERYPNGGVQDFCFYVRSGDPYLVMEYNNEGLCLSYTPWPGWNPLALRRSEGSDPRSQANPSGLSPNIVIFDATIVGASGSVVFNPGTLEEHVIGNGGRFPWPCLSPNGTKVVAGSDGGVDQGLYIMNLDGSNLRQLTTSLDHQPTWSNGVLVFVRIGAGGSLTNGDLYLMHGINE